MISQTEILERMNEQEQPCSARTLADSFVDDTSLQGEKGVKGMIYFEPEGFEEYYDYILKGGASKGYYIDPDCQQDIGLTNYYNLLTEFLNCREREVIAQEEQFQYLPPKKAKNTSEEDQSSLLADDYKISVIKNGEKRFRLTSDQFGFSAFEEIFLNVSKRGNYPLSRMMLLSQNEDEEKQKM